MMPSSLTVTPMNPIILLLVEDNKSFQTVLEDALESQGFEVVLAGNGT
jgi:CheY-like chemotaxis protein